jgi:PPOX class probable F420-dependent enzyme
VGADPEETSNVDLPEDLIALLRQPSSCYLATTMPDGSPHLTQTWVDTDGEHIVINTVQGFQKARNVERDPRVAVSVSDPSNPSRYYAVRGRVVKAATEGGSEPGWPLPLVWGPRPGASHPHHRRRQDSRDGVGDA